MLQDSANRKSPTIAHVEGRLKCLLLPNRNVWSAVLSRAHRGALLRAANTDSARFLSSSPTDFFCHLDNIIIAQLEKMMLTKKSTTLRLFNLSLEKV